MAHHPRGPRRVRLGRPGPDAARDGGGAGAAAGAAGPAAGGARRDPRARRPTVTARTTKRVVPELNIERLHTSCRLHAGLSGDSDVGCRRLPPAAAGADCALPAAGSAAPSPASNRSAPSRTWRPTPCRPQRCAADALLRHSVLRRPLVQWCLCLRPQPPASSCRSRRADPPAPQPPALTFSLVCGPLPPGGQRSTESRLMYQLMLLSKHHRSCVPTVTDLQIWMPPTL